MNNLISTPVGNRPAVYLAAGKARDLTSQPDGSFGCLLAPPNYPEDRLSPTGVGQRQDKLGLTTQITDCFDGRADLRAGLVKDDETGEVLLQVSNPTNQGETGAAIELGHIVGVPEALFAPDSLVSSADGASAIFVRQGSEEGVLGDSCIYKETVEGLHTNYQLLAVVSATGTIAVI